MALDKADALEVVAARKAAVERAYLQLVEAMRACREDVEPPISYNDIGEAAGYTGEKVRYTLNGRHQRAILSH
jgi:hypothetical protein